MIKDNFKNRTVLIIGGGLHSIPLSETFYHKGMLNATIILYTKKKAFYHYYKSRL